MKIVWIVLFFTALALDASSFSLFLFHTKIGVTLILFAVYSCRTLDYKKVSLLGFSLGIGSALFSIFPASIFVISYLAMGNGLVFVLRNITSQNKLIYFAISCVSFLFYGTLFTLILALYSFFGWSDIAVALGAETLKIISLFGVATSITLAVAYVLMSLVGSFSYGKK